MSTAETPAVRFSDANDEIQPPNLEATESGASQEGRSVQDLNPETKKELQNLSLKLKKSRLQSSRMENFGFEPVSLPPSRAQSPARGARSGPRHGSTTRSADAPSPPLTPAQTDSQEAGHSSRQGSSTYLDKPQAAPETITPEASLGQYAPSSSIDERGNEATSTAPSTRPQSSTGQISTPPTSTSDSAPQQKPQPTFPAGPQGDSAPPSGDSSPPPSAPASVNEEFHNKYKGATARIHDAFAPHSQPTLQPHKASIARDAKGVPVYNNKRLSVEDDHQQHRHGSMSDLKRFFKLGGHKHKDKHEKEKHSSLSEPRHASKSDKSGIRTPPTQHSAQASVPFADDHGLQSKYGKFGKVLGSGAGGSVRLMKRSSDGTTFAVKQFRGRHGYESEKEYNKKVTAEFCIGSTLHHGNVIETMDIVHEKGSWYEVMEYAPYDLFAIVMSGKMSREEITCCTVQVLNGVAYLHSMGLAHRDLKLDNVVVNDQGIMKLIDFGSATVFRYPFENDVVKARGIVGSDPYLAPEVYDENKYDPQAVDMWSIAIMYCCMTLRRFPWKAPRVSDSSFKLFVSPATPGQPTVESLRSAQSKSETATPVDSATPDAPATHSHSHSHGGGHHHRHHGSTASIDSTNGSTATESPAPAAPAAQQPQSIPNQVIKGPWRLLRLLPRESRIIIGRMLEVDPDQRATLEEVYGDRFVAAAPHCRQDEGGKIYRAPGHDHVLEPGGTNAGE